jgi:hypothetical protein
MRLSGIHRRDPRRARPVLGGPVELVGAFAGIDDRDPVMLPPGRPSQALVGESVGHAGERALEGRSRHLPGALAQGRPAFLRTLDRLLVSHDPETVAPALRLHQASRPADSG